MLPPINSTIIFSGLAMMLGGGVIALCKDVPKHAWKLIRDGCSACIEIKSTNVTFDYMNEWLNTLPYSQKTRRLLLVGRMFVPTYGDHFFLYQGRPIWLARQKDQNDKVISWNEKESFYLRTLGRTQEPLRQLLSEIVAQGENREKNHVSVYECTEDGWRMSCRVGRRDPASVILKTGQWELLINDAQKFFDGEQTYRNLGVPYRRGYLLYGAPGTGKSSTVLALASELRIPIYIMNLGAGFLTDGKLSARLSELPARAILLLEDVDAMFKKRVHVSEDDDKEKRVSGVTLSGLLNSLDGITSAQGRLLFMTTNHAEVLDPALIRAGRTDLKLEIGLADADQITRAVRRFVPDATATELTHFISGFTGKSMADVQGALLQRIGLYNLTTGDGNDYPSTDDKSQDSTVTFQSFGAVN